MKQYGFLNNKWLLCIKLPEQISLNIYNIYMKKASLMNRQPVGISDRFKKKAIEKFQENFRFITLI